VIRSAEITLSASTNFSCTISHIEGADLVAFTNSTLSCDADAGKFAEAVLSSSSSLSMTVSKITGYSAILNNYVSQTTVFDRIRSTASSVNVVSTVNVIGNVNRSAESSQSSSASLSCTISHIEGADMVAFAGSTCSSTASVIRGYSATLNNYVAQTTIFDRFRGIDCLLPAQIDITVNGITVRLAKADLEVIADLTSDITLIKQATVDISSALNFQVAVREIDLDTILQYVYVIPADNREYKIKEETRIYSLRR
jgi:hypothetical protein